MTPRLEHLDDAHLVLGRNPGENVHVPDALGQLLVGGLVQLCAGDYPTARPQQADLLRDGAGRIGIIARNHHRADAGRPRLFHCWPDLWPGRINHRHQPDQT